ncbi:hypothetical protein [Aliivibrio salmonicida]|uniref:hypothetical protein n=1 Tax=Aliivibrio salmonicida TaxID=40269 RepID=UPI003D11B8D6
MSEQIEDYRLFEEGPLKGTMIHFRNPTVADYRHFAAIESHLEESITTQYLNRMQIAELYDDGKIIDSATWTAEDRRTALWWIYMNTRENTVISQSYKCSHCDSTHIRQIDLADLVQYLIEPECSMVESITVDGIKPGYIQPLRGHAMDFLEGVRNERDQFDEDSPQWNELHVDLRLYETAWGLLFKDDDESLSLDEQAEARYQYLLTLNPDKQYKKLAAQVRTAYSSMRHGLMSEYVDGEIKLVTPPHECPVSVENLKEGDKPAETVLLLPFWYNHFLPNV